MRTLFSLQTIKNKFLIVMMLIAIISASITSGTLIYYESIDAKEFHQDKLELMSSVISPSLTAAVAFNDTDTINELIMPTIKTEGIYGVVVYNSENQIIAEAVKQELSPFTPDRYLQVATDLQLEGSSFGRLVFYTDYSAANKQLSFFIQLVVQILVGTLILSFIFSIFFSRIITKPLSNLIKTAACVTSTNNYTLRANQVTKDEIGDLTACFNAMLNTVQQRDNKLESTVKERTQALAEANKKLHHQAHEDALSGLPNRRSLYSYLNRAIEGEKTFCLLFIDLDGFKNINDNFGHDYGDELLQQAGDRIVECVRVADFVARLGGDEFMVILNELTVTDRINEIAGEILNSLSQAFCLRQESVFVSASIGITLFPEDGMSVAKLITNADHAMYESKRQGKNCFHYFSQEMQHKMEQKKLLVEDLHKAVQSEEFELFYQPIVCLKTKKVKKVEALIRWCHPRLGILAPDYFLPTIEEEGLMDKLGYWIAKKAANDILRWQKELQLDVELSINVSPSQFKSEQSLLRKWMGYIEALDLEAKQIVVEITENSLMENSENVHSLMKDMRAKGIRIAVDDFGVGYSSLAYLQQLNLDILKIDKSFVANLTHPESSFSLCKGMIAIANELNLTVIAEGIETEAQRQMLIQAGCEYGQGYLFAKPLPLKQFESFALAQAS